MFRERLSLAQLHEQQINEICDRLLSMWCGNLVSRTHAPCFSFFSAAVVPWFAAAMSNRGTEGAECLGNGYRYSFLLPSALIHFCNRSACTQPTVQYTRFCVRINADRQTDRQICTHQNRDSVLKTENSV